MIKNQMRPYLFGFRTLFVLLLLKMRKRCKIYGWRYFFGSWGNIRLDRGELIMNGCWVENHVLLHCISGTLEIGKNVFINRGTLIACMNKIRIAQDVLIGDNVSIYDHDHGLVNRSEYVTKPVVISEGVWLGSHVVVLKGVCIGEGSIVGAGSVVTKDIPPYEIWGGVPAKFIRKIET